MKRPLYDHLWTKIIERNSLAEGALEQKIKEHEEIYTAIESAEGKDAAKNVMDLGLIGHCLARCLEHLRGGPITEKDYYVFYGYASNAAKKAEEIIDNELSHLGL